MPADVKRAEFSLLLQCFLQVVFTKMALSGQIGGGNDRRSLGFADRQQVNAARMAMGLSFRLLYLGVDMSEIISDAIHACIVHNAMARV